MTTIKETLKDYYSDNFFTQITLCHKLQTDLTNLAKNHAGWKFFCNLIENGQYGQNLKLTAGPAEYHPDNIDLLATTIFGVSDIDKLGTWLEAFNASGINSGNLIDITNPTLELTLGAPIPASVLVEAVKSACPAESNCMFKYVDSEYYAITEDDLDLILETCQVDKLKYSAEGRDCDDFSRLTRAFLAKHGYGNVTVFYAEGNAYKDGVYQFAHAINLAVVVDAQGEYRCIYFEPQSDVKWGATEQMPWGLGDLVDFKLRYLLM